MMKFKILLPAVLAIGFCFASTRAQTSTGKWPSLFGNKSDESEYVEPVEIGDEPPGQNGLGDSGQWSWRPRAWEWKQPAFMKRMSENTARSWRNTRRGIGNWMSQTGTAIRDTSYDTWENITRATTPRWSSRKERDEPRTLSPGNGRVQEFLARPRVKF